MVQMILGILDYLLYIAGIVIVVQAVLSILIAFNVVNLHNDFVRGLWQGLERMTDPIYRPIRRILPDFGGLDFSPLVVLIFIQILRSYVLPTIGVSLLY